MMLDAGSVAVNWHCWRLRPRSYDKILDPSQASLGLGLGLGRALAALLLVLAFWFCFQQ